MVIVKKVRKLGLRGGPIASASHGTSSARPEFAPTTAPCASRCPGGTDVRGFLQALGRAGAGGLTDAQAIEDAFYIVAEGNPLPAVCGWLCPHRCEDGCTREAYDGGVAVNQVERALGEAAIAAGLPLRRMAAEPRGEAVTVIGAGAAGLSAAYQFARRGYAVTLADPHDEPGGELRYGVGPDLLPRPVLDAEIARVLALGVRFVPRAGVAEGGPGLAEAGATPPPVASAQDAAGVAPASSSAGGRVVRTRLYEDRRAVPPGAVPAAIQFGRRAAELLDAEVRGVRVETAPKRPVAAKDRLRFDHYPTTPRAAAGQALTPEAAIVEARRCLVCGACIECDNCWKYCPDQAVLRPLGKGQPYRFRLEFCQGCRKCAEECPTGYIEMR
jgi:Pyruvate/2-oxoacid:ferredoxin oxidoreductase delta subunit